MSDQPDAGGEKGLLQRLGKDTGGLPFVVGVAVYSVLVIAGSVMRDSVGEDSRWMILVAAATIAAALATMVVVIRAGRRSKELERFLFTEATSIAFFVTMLAALTYGLLESWLELPRLSAWATWSVGMTSWAVLSIAMRRRVS